MADFRLVDPAILLAPVPDVYPSLGYEVAILPKVSVPERADFVLNTLAE